MAYESVAATVDRGDEQIDSRAGTRNRERERENSENAMRKEWGWTVGAAREQHVLSYRIGRRALVIFFRRSGGC